MAGGGGRRRRRQVALVVLAALLLNAPVLVVVDRLAAAVPGVPLTPAFLFAAWLLLIGLGALNAARPGRGSGRG